MRTVVILVTNDLHQDQRMNRIALSLTKMFDKVTLVGRLLPSSKTISSELGYQTERHQCTYNSGMRFYGEIAYKHFKYLQKENPKVVYAVDVDTLLPAVIYRILNQNVQLIYDAHEWFTEVPELEGQYLKKSIWSAIERLGVKYSDIRYTVSTTIAKVLEQTYGKPFGVIRNVPTKKHIKPTDNNSKMILYQGMLNQGRGLEQMIKAMHFLPNHNLCIVGDGDIRVELEALANECPYDNITFIGWVDKEELHELTQTAWIGINLLEATSKSYYYSLANKFFDYIQAGVPMITMDYPEYKALNEEYDVAALIAHLDTQSIVNAVRVLDDSHVYKRKQQNCGTAAQKLNWEEEEQKLLSYLTVL